MDATGPGLCSRRSGHLSSGDDFTPTLALGLTPGAPFASPPLSFLLGLLFLQTLTKTPLLLAQVPRGKSP